MAANTTTMYDYDTPWKKALEQYFDAFIDFFFPHIHAGIDWQQGGAFRR